jgi:hypothetical protein
MYPTSPVRPAVAIQPQPPQPQQLQQQQQQQQSVAPVAAAPLPQAELPTVAPRPVRGSRAGDRDVRIQVARKHTGMLKRAVRAAKLPKAARKQVRYVRSGRTLTLVVRGARTSANDHTRGEWVRRIVGRLDRHGVKVLSAQL